MFTRWHQSKGFSSVMHKDFDCSGSDDAGFLYYRKTIKALLETLRCLSGRQTRYMWAKIEIPIYPIKKKYLSGCP